VRAKHEGTRNVNVAEGERGKERGPAGGEAEREEWGQQEGHSLGGRRV